MNKQDRTFRDLRLLAKNAIETGENLNYVKMWNLIADDVNTRLSPYKPVEETYFLLD